MLDYKVGRGVQESGKKWLRNKWMLLTMSFLNFYQFNLYFFCLKVLILGDISAEFYLNFKFIIINIIMYSNCSNCAITSFKHLWFIFPILFQTKEPFLHLQKTLQNLRLSDVFRGCGKGTLAWKRSLTL